jgi:tetratricopeptide (TPR) repeat protein
MLRRFSWSAVLVVAANCLTFAANVPVKPAPTLIDTGFRQMYNLQFDDAHKTFAEAQRANPNDPMVPVSNAAAYLFAEFDRLHILEADLFVNDGAYAGRAKLSPDPRVKQDFDTEMQRATALSDTALAKNPNDHNALFAKVMVFGLNGDYSALIEKRDLKGLSYIKQGRELADKLLAVDPTCYDAYIAVGVENYLLSLKPAPVRWFLNLTGAETDKETGLEKLRITAAKGHYLMPYARLLLAVAALRDHQTAQARSLLEGLAREFPHNRLYVSELAKLKPPEGSGQNLESHEPPSTLR